MPPTKAAARNTYSGCSSSKKRRTATPSKRSSSLWVLPMRLVYPFSCRFSRWQSLPIRGGLRCIFCVLVYHCDDCEWFVLRLFIQISLLLKCSLCTNFMSCSAMMRTNSSKPVCRGFQPNNVLALVGSPSSCSTSEGRKYLGSTSTSTFPVRVSIPFRQCRYPPNAVVCLLP